MDVDQFIRENEPVWAELGDLATRMRSPRRSRRLDGAELERAIQLYQRTSTHLSYSRTWYGDSALTARLTVLVGEARAAIYGVGDRTGNAVARFFREDFPGAVWRGRRFIGIAAALLLAPALYVGIWMTYSDAAFDAAGPDVLIEDYINEDFEAYYSSEPAAQFSTEVLINNIQVSFLAYAMGIFAAVGTAVVLLYNGLFVGQAAGLFHAAGEPTKFWGLILPHGLIELTAVAVAGGAGLQLGWAMIAPGDRSRGVAVAEEGRRSVPIVVGLMLVFVIAGLIEGFVTPSSLPTTARVGIGVLVEIAFLSYIAGFGRLAELSRADRVI